MKKKTEQTVAFIAPGHSRYDDELWALLRKLDDDEVSWCSDYDDVDLMDCFVLAGASVSVREDDNVGGLSVYLTIPKGVRERESFLWRVQALVQRKIRYLKARTSDK